MKLVSAAGERHRHRSLVLRIEQAYKSNLKLIFSYMLDTIYRIMHVYWKILTDIIIYLQTGHLNDTHNMF